MINEEDHLRMQVLRPGLELQKTFQGARQCGHRPRSQARLRFSPATRISDRLPNERRDGDARLRDGPSPGLVLSEQINQVIHAMNKIGLAVRGLYGEGTEAMGNLFQISNQTTLGENESQIIDRLNKVIEKMVQRENQARENLLQKKRPP